MGPDVGPGAAEPEEGAGAGDGAGDDVGFVSVDDPAPPSEDDPPSRLPPPSPEAALSPLALPAPLPPSSPLPPPSPYTGQGGELLPPQAVPCPTVPRPIEFVTPALPPRAIQEMTPPAAPTPVMPQPVPPAVQMPYSISLGSGLRVVVPPLSQTPKTDRDTTLQLFNFYVGIQNQQYASDPNIRMQKMLYSQEGDDLRTIQNEWRRFWFNDQPNLTPERIHGGIR